MGLVLFHGTSDVFLPSILSSGILPREGRGSNWVLESHPRAVYLTAAYALHYAEGAVATHGGSPLILQVEVPREPLFPDEDFVGEMLQALSKGRLDLAETIKKVQIEDYKSFWRLSLTALGNVAYMGTIEPGRILRYAIVKNAHVRSLSDPVICLQNYLFMGEYYKRLTSALVGDGMLPAPGGLLPDGEGWSIEVLRPPSQFPESF